MKKFKIKNIRFPLLLVTIITLLFSACKKDNLDESDPNVYQWQVIYYRHPLFPDNNGGPQLDFSKPMIEFKREKLSLTNKEVNELKRKFKKDKDVRVEFKKI